MEATLNYWASDGRSLKRHAFIPQNFAVSPRSTPPAFECGIHPHGDRLGLGDFLICTGEHARAAFGRHEKFPQSEHSAGGF